MRSQLKKPGFSDNSSIAAEILFRDPVSHPHAIASPKKVRSPISNHLKTLNRLISFSRS
ncbi:MAG: hypothetical protein U7126_13540 [Microcoleus sp.]